MLQYMYTQTQDHMSESVQKVKKKKNRESDEPKNVSVRSEIITLPCSSSDPALRPLSLSAIYRVSYCCLTLYLGWHKHLACLLAANAFMHSMLISMLRMLDMLDMLL